MTKSNGTGDIKARLAKAKPGGGLAPEVVAYLERRTQGFVKATAGCGKPVTYGHGRAPGEKKDKPGRG